MEDHDVAGGNEAPGELVDVVLDPSDARGKIVRDDEKFTGIVYRGSCGASLLFRRG